MTVFNLGAYNPTPAIALQVQGSRIDTKAETDAMIAWASGRVTDLFVYATNLTSPYVWSGPATLGRVTAVQVDGVTPFEYLISQANAAGLRVWAWIWIMSAVCWVGDNGIVIGLVDDANSNDGGYTNFHVANTRNMISAAIADFVVSNPGLYGVMYGHEDISAATTAADVTLFYDACRAAIPRNIPLIGAIAGNTGTDTYYKLETGVMLGKGTWDGVKIAYFVDMQTMKNYVASIGAQKKRVFWGISPETARTNPSDFAYRLLQHSLEGHTVFDFFVWGAAGGLDGSGGLDAENVSYFDAWQDGTLGVEQLPITSISVVPGDHFDIVVDGDEQTTAYADVAAHQTPGPLKAHVEAAVGSDNPAIIYYRWNSEVTYIMVGDMLI